MKKRIANINRKTKETDIKVRLNIDGSGKAKINTGIGILNHMLELLHRRRTAREYPPADGLLGELDSSAFHDVAIPLIEPGAHKAATSMDQLEP